MKLILEAYQIPNDAVVTRPTGNKKYTLLREIKFYPQSNAGNQSNIEAKDGCVFLLDERGHIGVYPPNTFLAWVVDRDKLHTYLHRLEEEREPQK